MYAEPKESLKLDEISNCVNEILIAGPNMLTPSSDNISVGNHPNVSTPFDGSTTNNNSPPTVELNIKVNQPPKFATEKPVENVEKLNIILEESNGADSSKKQDLTPVLSDNAYLETGRNDIRKKIKKDLTAPSTKTKGEKSLLSASSDSTIKVWNAHEGICMATLRPHRDYAKCLAYAKDVEVEASAGLEKTIYLWNIEDLAAFFSTKNNVKASKVHDKSSIYSLAISPHGTILACGSNEKAVGVYSVGVMNTKNPQNIMKLKGHSDNVRDMVLNRNGTQCLSSSSDGTIPLWSLGQQRGVATYRVHDKSMWALQANEFFTTVYSDERDRRVWATDLLNPDYRTLLRVEKFPILKPELEKGDTDYYSMWVATTDSTIKDWSGEYDNENIKPVYTQLNSTIEDCVNEILIAGPNMLTPSSDNISVGNHPNVSTPFDTPVLSDDDLETGRNDIRKEINTDLTAPSTKTKGEKSWREYVKGLGSYFVNIFTRSTSGIIYCENNDGIFKRFCSRLLPDICVKELGSEKLRYTRLFLVLNLPVNNRQNNEAVLSALIDHTKSKYQLNGKEIAETILVQISFDGNYSENPPNVMNKYIFERLQHAVNWNFASYIDIVYSGAYNFTECETNKKAKRRFKSIIKQSINQ